MITERQISELINSRLREGKPATEYDLFWTPPRGYYPDVRPDGKTTYYYVIRLTSALADGSRPREKCGTDAEGQPFSTPARCRTALRERLKKLKAMASAVTTNEVTRPLLLGEYLEETFTRETGLTAPTFEKYRSMLRYHVIPYVGSAPSHILSSSDLSLLYNELSKFGNHKWCPRKHDHVACTRDKQGRPLAPGVINNINVALSAMIRLDTSKATFPSNPCVDAVLPALPKEPDFDVWPMEDVDRFCEAATAQAHAQYAVFLLGLCGMRRAEIAAVRESRIVEFDVATLLGTIRIDKQLTWEGLKPPKGGKTRTITLSHGAVRALAVHLEQRRELIANGTLSPSDFVFVEMRPNSPYFGQPFRRTDKLANLFHQLLDDMNTVFRANGEPELPRIRFHELRHTFATLAIADGWDVKTLSGHLGHASETFTLKVYCKFLDSAAKKHMDNLSMNSAFGGTRSPNTPQLGQGITREARRLFLNRLTAAGVTDEVDRHELLEGLLASLAPAS